MTLYDQKKIIQKKKKSNGGARARRAGAGSATDLYHLHCRDSTEANKC